MEGVREGGIIRYWGSRWLKIRDEIGGREDKRKGRWGWEGVV